VIIINLFFAPHSIYTQRITMDLFQFRGGAASYPVSDSQVVSEISDAIGLGMELYVNQKKLDMLQNPSAYLEQRNKALQDRAGNTGRVYAEALNNVVSIIAGTDDKKNAAYIAASNQLWVKSIARDLAAKIAEVDIATLNIQYPILGSAYKAQKSKNSRDLEGKKEFIKEGTK
jgi:hypothetical protein